MVSARRLAGPFPMLQQETLLRFRPSLMPILSHRLSTYYLMATSRRAKKLAGPFLMLLQVAYRSPSRFVILLLKTASSHFVTFSHAQIIRSFKWLLMG